MAQILIDSNIFLDLYRTKTIKSLVKQLPNISNDIFVSKQTANEVIRNRVGVAITMVSGKFELPTIPDILDGSLDSSFKSDFENLCNNANKLNLKLEKFYEQTIQQIVNGTDEVSSTLSSLFQNSKEATDDELIRARSRKELGQPPGKKGDPLGDQLTWEQFVAQVTRGIIWVVSRDGDFVHNFKGKTYLNPVLQAELPRDADVRIFKDLASALKDISTTNKAVSSPSDETLQKAIQESEQLELSPTLESNTCIHKPTGWLLINGNAIIRCITCGKVLAAQAGVE